MSKYAIDRPVVISAKRRREIASEAARTLAANLAWGAETRRLEALPPAVRVYPVLPGDLPHWLRGLGGGNY
jgi:hypothetical protein